MKDRRVAFIDYFKQEAVRTVTNFHYELRLHLHTIVNKQIVPTTNTIMIHYFSLLLYQYYIERINSLYHC